MITIMTDYTFRSVDGHDLPLLQRWLRFPEVERWWGNPDEQLALLRDDLNDPRMDMRIVSFGDRPFAYAQDYAVDSWPQPHFSNLPTRSRAIDTFIGEVDMIGRGHGSTYLRLLAERLLAQGSPLIAVDPDEDNYRARRAYNKAGFRGDKVYESDRGPVILMQFRR
jgi:aminoglycoside 6'-N-acetyltransferase